MPLRRPAAGGAVGARRLLGMGSASCALVVVMAAVGAPAPLAAIYGSRYGVTTVGLTAAFATYILCAAFALTIAGEVSDYLGRRPVIVLALAFTAAGCLVLTTAHDVAALVGGRALQGCATGIGIGAAGTMVIELAGPRRFGLASVVASSAPTAGLAAGAVVSGALAERDPGDLSLVFVILAALSGTIAAGVVLSPETKDRAKGLLRSLAPSATIPAPARSIFVTACICFIGAYALGGLYQSMGPVLVDAFLQIRGTLFNGILVASVIGTSVIGAPLTARLRARHAMILGLAAMAGGSVVIATALPLGSPGVFLAASILGGLGFGAAFNGALRALLERTDAGARAGVISAVYLVSYVGAAVGTLTVGLASAAWGVGVVPLVYLALIAVVCLLGVVRLRRQDRGERGNGHAMIESASAMSSGAPGGGQTPSA